MAKITKSFVDKIVSPKEVNGKPKQTFYRDSTLPGFGLRVTSGGTKAYIVETRINNKVKRKTLGKHGVLTAEQARRKALSFLSQVAIGDNPIAKADLEAIKRTTLEEAFEDYLVCRKTLKESTIADYRRSMKDSFEDWKNKPLNEITKDMVEARHAKVGKRTQARANNAMRVLRAVFNHAIYKYEDDTGNPVFTINPVDRLSRNRAWYKIKRRQGYLKPHQLADWYQALQSINETTRDFLLLSLLTGLRRSETSSLCWENIDFKDRTLTVPETKNGETHILPLSDYLHDLLKGRYDESESKWVFPSKYYDGPLTEPRTAIDKVILKTDVKFTMHDLRRTFITIAESLDIPGYALKRLMNHKNPNDVTAGYIIANVDRLRAPMQQITDFILSKAQPDHNVIPLPKKALSAKPT